jgi:thiamine-phosphate pyrophosphorylase
MTKKLAGLYAITNEKLMPEKHFLAMAEAAISSGISIIQYRDKSLDKTKRLHQAHELKKLCDRFNVLFIINDDVELVKQVNADGIHIGRNDLSFAQARKQLGAKKIIGVTCYNKISLAKKAINDGADYIAFGSFFGSSIKPNAPKATIDLITFIRKEHTIPVCCIGGITYQNYPLLINAGADMVAVISDIFSQTSCTVISNNCKKFIFTNQG